MVARGETYFTGKPCKNGHITERNKYGKCLGCVRAKAKRFYANHKENHSKRCQRWRENNKERERETIRQWAIKNPERTRARKRRWQENHPGRMAELVSRWAKQNPEKNREKYRNWRARKLSAGGVHTKEDIAAISKAQRGKCALCRVDLAKAVRHVDHIVPLTRGGSNARQNIQLLCGTCNCRKGSKDPLDFSREAGLLL